MRLRLAWVTLLAAVLLVATSAVMLSASWYLECHDDSGNELGGIDCFQHNAIPRTNDAPASWVGFVALALIGITALVALVVCTFLALRQRRGPPTVANTDLSR